MFYLSFMISINTGNKNVTDLGKKIKLVCSSDFIPIL